MNRLFLDAARKHAARVAIVEEGGKTTVTYADLLSRSSRAMAGLHALGIRKGDRVCLFGDKTADYTAIQFGAWRLGGVSVTLLPSYPAKELEHFVRDSGARLLIAGDQKKAADVLSHIGGSSALQVATPTAILSDKSTSTADVKDADISPNDAASLIYTSGSTSLPKGVVTTHGALRAMVNGMISAWEWTPEDSILHFLPLHHVHGAINKLLTPLCVGARVEFVDSDPAKLLARLNDEDPARRPTVFMAVPTVYAKLVEKWEQDGNHELVNAHKLRLYVCGSAPLPVQLFNKFQELSTQRILERWGMTEVGMGLSNPLRPESSRTPGYVGLPMPGIEVRIVDLEADPYGNKLVGPNVPGDLIIRGDSVFRTYWGAAAAKTASEFTPDGKWFNTGDVAMFDASVNSYKIVGRKSVDVIKSGGYKISALEIERHLLECDAIDEVAVMGIPDPVWGESVVAIVVPKLSKDAPQMVTEQFVKDFAGQQMVKYKVPRQVLILKSIPKNAMGKVNKKALKALFEKGT